MLSSDSGLKICIAGSWIHFVTLISKSTLNALPVSSPTREQQFENLAADCSCPWSRRRYHKKEGREDEGGIHIPPLYFVELQKREERRTLKGKQSNSGGEAISQRVRGGTQNGRREWEQGIQHRASGYISSVECLSCNKFSRWHSMSWVFPMGASWVSWEWDPGASQQEGVLHQHTYSQHLFFPIL